MSSDGYFALASISGMLCLVLVSYETPLSALSTVDVKVFRHEFINIFRFSEERSLHPGDINIIERIADNNLRYEEDNETVFLAQVIMEGLRKYMNPRCLSLGIRRKVVASRLPGSRAQPQRQRQR